VRILFLSKDLSGISLCRRLRSEGHVLKVYIPSLRIAAEILKGLAVRVRSLESGLKWVGYDGLIVCDDIGFGQLQEDLRKRGFSVFGGCEAGDRLERDRHHSQEIMARYGLHTVPIHYFESVSDAIHFIKQNPMRWVIKKNGHADRMFCYVGRMPDGRDVINMLDNYYKKNPTQSGHVVLQKYIEGIEIACARYFNGNDWVGPIEVNIEHKRLFPGNVGPKTYEMGTLMWYDADENNRLFSETLARLKPYLREIGYRGDIDINCIVNETGAYPLEATARFGYPSTQLRMEIHESPWGEFLKAVAEGKDYPLVWKHGFGVVVLVACPPFPYPISYRNKTLSPRGLLIHFDQSVNNGDFQHIHFEDVTVKENGCGEKEHCIEADTGYVLHVSSHASSVEEARSAAYELIKKITIPRMFYRQDIGLKFIERDRLELERMGYLNVHR